MKDLVAYYARAPLFVLGPIGVPEVGDEADIKQRDGSTVRVRVVNLDADLLGVAYDVRDLARREDEDEESYRLRMESRARATSITVVRPSPVEAQYIYGQARRNRAARGLPDLQLAEAA